MTTFVVRHENIAHFRDSDDDSNNTQNNISYFEPHGDGLSTECAILPSALTWQPFWQLSRGTMAPVDNYYCSHAACIEI